MAMNFCINLMTQRLIQILLVTLIVLLLAGCGAGGSITQRSSSPEQSAQRAYAEGDFLQAARYWQQVLDTAELAGQADIDELRLETADAWVRGRDTQRGSELLAQIDPELLNNRQRAQFFIVQADNAMQQNNLQMAEFYLQAASQSLPSSLNPRYEGLQRTMANLMRDPSDRSLEETAELSESLLGYDPDRAVEILRSLESVPSSQLQMMVEQQSYEPGFTGWMELALQVRSQLLNQGSANTAAKKWQDSHPGHPINESNYDDLLRRYRALYPTPSMVAVLLPTEGGFAGVANAIRDGIVSAYLDHPDDAQLRFYSSGDTPESAISAYMQARADGAKQIIGPLDLQSTRAVSTLSDLTIPVLLLNEQASNVSITSGPKGSVNSLLMSQTAEAELIAERALSQGYKRAVVFVPDTDWGMRVEAAFSQAFSQGNGRVIALSRFNQDSNDQSVMLTRLLRIEESKQREAELRDWLGVPMDFEPSRRDDFDFIFLAATPTEGRELKPLLRFHDVGDVPVLAMGRVYSGEVNPTADQDLNSVIVPSTRWHLQAAQSETVMPNSVRGGVYGSFFAIGEDAWRLLPWLPLMQKDRDLAYSGQLGNLHVESDGRVYRDPAWAQFSNGKLVPYQWPDVY